jgi:pimeloyl-ACP methyl ester carboxylesterase
MDPGSLWRNIDIRDRRNLYIALTAPLVGATVLSLINATLSARTKPRILPSPRKSLQILSAQDLDDLPYPPDALPGARDVDTPYGNIRVYEWGPEEGRKVLFVHGISTPCIAFAGMAKSLVERGCRVILFDLFGRGYSDAPDPSIYRQDIGLWTSQILLVLSSSKLAWTGSDRFTLVGYSMGGGIGAAFTSYFPEMVESLVLIAPGGLLRPSRISRSSRLLYGNLLPAFVVNYYVGKRLRGSSGVHPAVGGKAKPATPANVAESEVPGHPANAQDSTAPIFPDRPKLSIAKAVAWETDAHPGFLPSFISSIKSAPVSNSHERWRQIGRRCEARRAAQGAEQVPGLDQNQVLVILGKQDAVIVADETEEDATAALGKENLRVVRLTGGHDVPTVNSKGCVEAMVQFWDDSPV